jgi:hypothetical protein
VSCVPPENKPQPAEINLPPVPQRGHCQCDGPIVAGRIAQRTVGAGQRRSAVPFAQGREYRKAQAVHELSLLALQHQTRVLTPAMFEKVFAACAVDA